MWIITIGILSALFLFFFFCDRAVVVFGVSELIFFCVCRQNPCMCRWGFSATDLYMPFLQKRFNFTDRINVCRQLVRDKEHGEASPPHRHAVCLCVLSFLLLDGVLCCLAEHETDSSTPNSLYFLSRLHLWMCMWVPSEIKFSFNLLIS